MRRLSSSRVAALTVAALAVGGGAQASVSVALDHSLRLPVSGHAASVVVGNPAVADVTVVDSRTLFVTGKRFGATDVVVLDPLGRTVYASDIQVVNGVGQHVRVFRAGQMNDLACDPACTAPATAGPDAATTASPFANPITALGGAAGATTAAPTTAGLPR